MMDTDHFPNSLARAPPVEYNVPDFLWTTGCPGRPHRIVGWRPRPPDLCTR